jgi:hypoxanthine phosphoribosyltransferase
MNVTAEARSIRGDARLVCSANEVEQRIRAMAGRIAAIVAGENPVVLAVMHGGVFTAVGLCRHFEFPYEFDYLHATRYRNRLTGGDLKWRVRPGPELAGRSVLLVDDVLDRGLTLTELERELRSVGVAQLRTAVLAAKRIEPRADGRAVDFVGVWTEDVYLFGCGMDYKGYWRGLPALYAVADDS